MSLSPVSKPVLNFPPRPPAVPFSPRASALVFEDVKSKALLERMHLIAPSTANVLVTGETGTGKELIAKHDATRARFNRVSDLVKGFESPFGLELLSTVHWLVSHDNVCTLSDLVERTYAWNERKRKFTPRQIGIAAEVLAKKGWTPRVEAL